MLNYFLFFLDNEFLTIRGLNRLHNLYKIIESCIRYILFSSYEKLYLSLAAVIENENANEFIRQYRNLFEKRFFIAMSGKSLNDFLYHKQDQYAHADEIAKKYRFCNFEHLIGLPYRTKVTDTTLYIESKLFNALRSNNPSLYNVEYYIEKVMERKKAAITHHLFQDIYYRKEVSERQQSIVNSLITEIYIMTYLDDFDGDIPIPPQMGLQDFTDLSKSFPINNIVMWYELYDKIGCSYYIENCKESDMLTIFNEEIFIRFINTVCEKMNNTYKSTNILQFIPRLPGIKNLAADEYLKRIETVTRLLSDWEYGGENEGKKGVKFRMEKARTVFIVHGRNKAYRKSVYDFLKALDLFPLEWERAVELTGKGAPETLEVVKKGILNSSGVVILFTGDEEACLLEELAEEGEDVRKVLQPRQNVVFEAGYAMSALPDKTIILKVGKVNISSDLKGLNYIELNNSIESRRNFKNRLKTIGLPIDDYTGEWETAGKF